MPSLPLRRIEQFAEAVKLWRSPGTPPPSSQGEDVDDGSPLPAPAEAGPPDATLAVAGPSPRHDLVAVQNQKAAEYTSAIRVGPRCSDSALRSEAKCDPAPPSHSFRQKSAERAMALAPIARYAKEGLSRIRATPAPDNQDVMKDGKDDKKARYGYGFGNNMEGNVGEVDGSLSLTQRRQLGSGTGAAADGRGERERLGSAPSANSVSSSDLLPRNDGPIVRNGDRCPPRPRELDGIAVTLESDHVPVAYSRRHVTPDSGCRESDGIDALRRDEEFSAVSCALRRGGGSGNVAKNIPTQNPGSGHLKNVEAATEKLPCGVTKRPSGKWQVQLHYAGKSRYMGVFDSMPDAAAAAELARCCRVEFDRGGGGVPTSPEQVKRNVASMQRAALSVVLDDIGGDGGGTPVEAMCTAGDLLSNGTNVTLSDEDRVQGSICEEGEDLSGENGCINDEDGNDANERIVENGPRGDEESADDFDDEGGEGEGEINEEPASVGIQEGGLGDVVDDRQNDSSDYEDGRDMASDDDNMDEGNQEDGSDDWSQEQDDSVSGDDDGRDVDLENDDRDVAEDESDEDEEDEEDSCCEEESGSDNEEMSNSEAAEEESVGNSDDSVHGTGDGSSGQDDISTDADSDAAPVAGFSLGQTWSARKRQRSSMLPPSTKSTSRFMQWMGRKKTLMNSDREPNIESFEHTVMRRWVPPSPLVVKPKLEKRLSNLNEERWKRNVAGLKVFKAKYGHTNVPYAYASLGPFVRNARALYRYPDHEKNWTLTDERRRMLEELDFQWTLELGKTTAYRKRSRNISRANDTVQNMEKFCREAKISRRGRSRSDPEAKANTAKLIAWHVINNERTKLSKGEKEASMAASADIFLQGQLSGVTEIDLFNAFEEIEQGRGRSNNGLDANKVSQLSFPFQDDGCFQEWLSNRKMLWGWHRKRKRNRDEVAVQNADAPISAAESFINEPHYKAARAKKVRNDSGCTLQQSRLQPEQEFGAWLKDRKAKWSDQQHKTWAQNLFNPEASLLDTHLDVVSTCSFQQWLSVRKMQWKQMQKRKRRKIQRTAEGTSLTPSKQTPASDIIIDKEAAYDTVSRSGESMKCQSEDYVSVTSKGTLLEHQDDEIEVEEADMADQTGENVSKSACLAPTWDEVNEYLQGWLLLQGSSLMPSLEQKQSIMKVTGLTKVRLEGWFYRARKKKKSSEKYRENTSLGEIEKNEATDSLSSLSEEVKTVATPLTNTSQIAKTYGTIETKVLNTEQTTESDAIKDIAPPVKTKTKMPVGVRQRANGKWEVVTHYYGKRLYIGIYPTLEQGTVASEIAREKLITSGAKPSDEEIGRRVKLAREAAARSAQRHAQATKKTPNHITPKPPDVPEKNDMPDSNTLGKPSTKPAPLADGHVSDQSKQKDPSIDYRTSGVRQMPSGKWEVRLRYHGNRWNMGTFDTQKDAALANEFGRQMLKTNECWKSSSEDMKRTVQLAREAALNAVENLKNEAETQPTKEDMLKKSRVLNQKSNTGDGDRSKLSLTRLQSDKNEPVDEKARREDMNSDSEASYAGCDLMSAQRNPSQTMTSREQTKISPTTYQLARNVPDERSITQGDPPTSVQSNRLSSVYPHFSALPNRCSYKAECGAPFHLVPRDCSTEDCRGKVHQLCQLFYCQTKGLMVTFSDDLKCHNCLIESIKISEMP